MSSTVHKSSLTSTDDDQDASYDPEEMPLTQLLSVSTTILAQALDLVENVLTSDEQLTIHSKYLPGSTIGIVEYLILFPPTEQALQANTYDTRGTTFCYCLIRCLPHHLTNFVMTFECGIHPWNLIWLTQRPP